MDSKIAEMLAQRAQEFALCTGGLTLTIDKWRLSGGGGVLAGKAAENIAPNSSKALASIRAKQPDNATQLTVDDVHVYYGVAASGMYMPDRYGFLAESSLKNIEAGLNAGVSYMLRHETGGYFGGGLNAVGRTHFGRYDAETRKSYYGMYMLKGSFPNGNAEVGTDEISRQMNGGVFFDVSVGLGRGTKGEIICNVCDHPLMSMDREGNWLCRHWPGTFRGMTEDDIAKSKRLGVETGCATWRAEHLAISELSTVYDGAIGDAGTREAAEIEGTETMNEEEKKSLAAMIADAVKGALGLGKKVDEPISETQSAEQLAQKARDEKLDAARAKMGETQSKLEAAIEQMSKASADQALTSIEARIARCTPGKMNVTEGDSVRKMAAEISVEAAAAYMTVVEARADNLEFTRGNTISPEDVAAAVDAGSTTGDATRDLDGICQRMMKADPKLSYGEAMLRAEAQYPELARKYSEQSGGN